MQSDINSNQRNIGTNKGWAINTILFSFAILDSSINVTVEKRHARFNFCFLKKKNLERKIIVFQIIQLKSIRSRTDPFDLRTEE